MIDLVVMNPSLPQAFWKPIGNVVLGRLEVDQAFQGRGLGRALLRDAALRVSQAAGLIGIRGLPVHAIADDAKAFLLVPKLQLGNAALEALASRHTLYYLINRQLSLPHSRLYTRIPMLPNTFFSTSADCEQNIHRIPH